MLRHLAAQKFRENVMICLPDIIIDIDVKIRFPYFARGWQQYVLNNEAIHCTFHKFYGDGLAIHKVHADIYPLFYPLGGRINQNPFFSP